ncbi:MAG: MBL fold metallo-hydrolase [Promethearchaeota archaeon]
MEQLAHGITWLLGQGLDCNVFIIESEDESLLIDSGLGGRINYGFGVHPDSLRVLKKAIEQKNIEQVFLTHGHIDHVGGIMALQSQFDFKISTSKIEAEYLKTGNSSYIEPFLGSTHDSASPPIKVSHELEEGMYLDIGEFSFQVLHTPGHTHGSSCLWDKSHRILVSGDTVFPQGSFGRTDLLSGSDEELLSSLRRLSELNVTILLPGHMPPVISTTSSPINSIKQSFENARMMLAY